MKSKVLQFLLSLVIALGIWVYVVSVVSPEYEVTIHSIPVELVGADTLADRNLIIVSNKNFTVDLKLLGNRVDLKKLSASNITIQADLSQIKEPGEHTIRYDIIYPSIVQSGNIDALEKHPQHITLIVAERGTKQVPVKVKYKGSVPADYVADRQNPQINHKTVTITGPVAELERVDHASILVDLTDQVSTITGVFRPTICDANGNALVDAAMLSCDVKEIQTTIKIQKIKTVPIVVEVIPGGGLTEDDVKLTLSIDSIVVSGSEAALEDLNQIVVGQIYLSNLLDSTTMDFEISLPAGVGNVTGATSVTVEIILLRELQVQEFEVMQIFTVNEPQNCKVTLLTRSIRVKIRGTEEALAYLRQNPDNIVAVVDCSDVSDGHNQNMVLNVTIKITNENGAGAVGEYTVTVNVSASNAGG